MALDEGRLRQFAEDAIGGPVGRLERTPMGSSRVTFLLDATDSTGRARELVLRCDSGDGPMSGTDIDLAHEAVFYRALADQPVRIPRLVAESDDGTALLVERARGSENLAELDDADREAVERDFGCALAELHAVDPAKLPLGDIARPKSAADHALLDLTRWMRFQDERVTSPSRVSRFTGDWLGRNAPDRVGRTALCHGDAGVGNFLHDGQRVTAILDWEFAHLGDPLDDIAWVLVRSHVTGGTGMRPALLGWAEHSGIPLEPDRIAYFRALVLLRMAISCEIALAQAGDSGNMDTSVYQILLPYLGFLLPQSLREAGCAGPALDALEESANDEIAAHPVLRGAARPLLPVEEIV